MTEDIIQRKARGNPLVWAKAKRKLKEHRGVISYFWNTHVSFLGELQDIGDDWPECMTPHEIASFQYPDSSEDFFALCNAMESAIRDGDLKPNATKVFTPFEGREVNHHFIRAADFWGWFKPFGEPSEVIREWVNAWVEETETEDGGNMPGDNWRTDDSLIKGEKQEIAIWEAIKIKHWNPMNVPDGEKGTLEELCKAEYPELFTAYSAFESTWKRGLKAKKWRMQSYASHSRRGRR